VSEPLSARELAERIKPETARTLRTLAFAMGAGIAMLVLVVGFLYARSTPPAPTPQSLRVVNMLTVLAMGGALVAIAASEILWKQTLAKVAGDKIDEAVSPAFILRSAVREGAALLGGVAALLAEQSGVLRAYPAYWATLAPAVLFWSYLFIHWPSDENLKSEVAASLPSVPRA